MTKNYVELKIQANPYQMISEAVKGGLAGGMCKFFKHSGSPWDEKIEQELLNKQHQYIMDNISELLYEEGEEE